MSSEAATFTDKRGRRLSREDVELLARQNMRGSSEPTASRNDFELLEWATDANGEFSDPQVEFYGLEYLP